MAPQGHPPQKPASRDRLPAFVAVLLAAAVGVMAALGSLLSSLLNPLRRDVRANVSVMSIVAMLVTLLLGILVAIIGLQLIADNSDDVIENVGDINNAITNNSFNDTTVDNAKGNFTAIFAILGLAFLLSLVASVLVVRSNGG